MVAHKAMTGVPGLDDILAGGLTKGHVFLVEGNPGTGKTTVALRFLMEGSALGEKCLYITMSETERELRNGAASHGWTLDSNIEVFELVPAESLLDADQQQSLLYSSELELGEAAKAIFKAYEQFKPERVVLDSLSEIRLLAQSSLRYRRQILTLKHYFAHHGATVLLLDDRTSESSDKTAHSIVHGVVQLEELAPTYGAERRRLRVSKYRGQSFRGGYHDFTISTGGVTVFPRLVAAEHRSLFKRTQVESNIAALDALLGGGIEQGSSTLILGPAGTGKSTFTLQFVVAACQRGENAAIFAFDEELGLLFDRAKVMGFDLEFLRDQGLLHIEQVDAAELTLGEFAHRVRSRVDKYGVKTVVIDSLNGYQAAMPEENSMILHVHELLQYLNRQGTNTFLTVAQHGLIGDTKAPIDVTYLADTVILLRYFESSGRVRRAVSVIKKRTGPHEGTIREYKISSNGLSLGEPLSQFEGVLRSVPTFVGKLPLFDDEPMVTQIPNSTPIRALIFTPNGRDSVVAASLLESSEIPSVVCRDASAFYGLLDERASFAIATEEALSILDLHGVRASLGAQPAWSDLPFIILTHGNASAEYNSVAKALSDQLGNVTFLERPFHRTTFISVAKTALKSRQRQLDTRARMEELHEGEQRLRNALLAGHLGTWELDLTSWSLSTSPAYKALFGRKSNDDFSYDDFISSIHPGDRSRVEEALRGSLRSTSDYLAEYRTIWRDGSLHWAEFRARLVRDRFGRYPRLVGVSTDITDRKTGEQILKQLNETLEQRVALRTSELEAAHAKVLAEIENRERAVEHLRQAQKIEMIGQLTGGVAHDFNNLLMVVLGSLDLLRENVPADAKVMRLIDSASLGAQCGAALTQRLLAFARKQDLKVESQSLTELVLGASDLIERSLGAQVELKLDLPPGLPLALVDANQIESAVLNLVVNSRDAMPDGGVLTIRADQVVIDAESDLPAGCYIRLIVEDSGQGMDARTLEKATEPFFSTKEVGKGTGLGLSMVHGLAVQLNGTLRLSSVIGQGTRAELWLPATNLLAKEETDRMDAVIAQDFGKLTILVVDDDVLVAMGTTDMLEDLGHIVLTSNSGDEAIGILKEDRLIDLMITDFSMPRMNGGQLAIAARAIRPDLPILLATGYAELPQGSDLDLPRISKPYLQQQLAEEIDKLLQASSAL